jgi:hypothetical protein
MVCVRGRGSGDKQTLFSVPPPCPHSTFLLALLLLKGGSTCLVPKVNLHHCVKKLAYRSLTYDHQKKMLEMLKWLDEDAFLVWLAAKEQKKHH